METKTHKAGDKTHDRSPLPVHVGLGRFLRSVTFRLLLYLLSTIGAVTAVYALVNFQTTRNQLTGLAETSALNTSELIKRATHYGMLLNRKEDIHQTIRQLAISPGVAGIRVYDKQGTIIFSANSKEIGNKVNQQAEACVNCHAAGLAVPSTEPTRRSRQFELDSGQKILGLINPIRNEPGCATAACHAHPPEQKILGVLDVQMSMDFVDQAVSSTKRQLVWATLAMLLIVNLGTTIFIHRVIHKPVDRLHEGTRQVAAGDFSTRIEIHTDDELGYLAEAFNRMTEDLQVARAELTDWSSQLEARVVQKTEELSQVQRHVAHMEKMASLGKLSATVAHELNNPLAGILNYAKLIGRQLHDETLPQASREELERYVQLIQNESIRCGNIVRNLLTFARQSNVPRAPASINELVERSLMLIRHHLQLADIKLETQLLEGNDELVCDAGQIQQALVALLINSVEALNGVPNGLLSVKLRPVGDDVEIELRDTGTGIPTELMDQVFEPFFSTKGREGGVGLGLAVVYGVMRRHGYKMDVESSPDKGTTFRLLLTREPHPPETPEPPPPPALQPVSDAQSEPK
ncbi:MAG: HAMP domain-containing protein [Candidatus Riflebacteria bacterium]|nr:HAMP domain-containing protein [Candidatus Riflebacteria bacterium]